MLEHPPCDSLFLALITAHFNAFGHKSVMNNTSFRVILYLILKNFRVIVERCKLCEKDDCLNKILAKIALLIKVKFSK